LPLCHTDTLEHGKLLLTRHNRRYH
jgi:hypothetical protein